MHNVHIYKDHIDTDVIIPARYLNTSQADELAKHCMEDIDASFVDHVSPGDFIVGGYNFGCGSSREHAPIAIKAAGIQCVIAKTFARIFFRNAFNIGLPVIESEEIVDMISKGDKISINYKEGIFINHTSQMEQEIPKLPDFMLAMIKAGGLVNYTKELK